MSNYKCSVLVVDDERYILASLSALLSQDFEVHTADSAEAAQDILQKQEIDLLLTDQHMPGTSGVQLLDWARQHSPKTIRLLMTGMARIEDAIDAINCGQVYRYLFKPWRGDQLLQILRNAARTFLLERSHEQLLEQLRNLNCELEERVQQRTRELAEANRQLQQKNSMLERLALTDALTGLPNRRAMDRLVRNELRRRARYASPLALAIVDADHFKDINTRFLLPGGDQALIQLARTLTGCIRTVDTVGRIGGEEFMVVAPETSLEGGFVLAERIRSTVEATLIPYHSSIIRLTVSVGLAVADTGMPASYEQMKLLAAGALEEAKANGRNRCVIKSLAHGGLEVEVAESPDDSAVA